MRKLVLYIPTLEVKVLTKEGIWQPHNNGSFVPKDQDYRILDDEIQRRFYDNWEQYNLDFLFPDLCYRFDKLWWSKDRGFYGTEFVKCGGSWCEGDWITDYEKTPEYKAYLEHQNKCYKRYIAMFR